MGCPRERVQRGSDRRGESPGYAAARSASHASGGYPANVVIGFFSGLLTVPPGGVSGVDEHSLRLLEFPRVTAAVAERAACEAARAAVIAARPFADRAALALECERLAQAIRRVAEPGEWVATGRGLLGATIGTRVGRPASLDGPALVLVLTWLDAGVATRAAWVDEPARRREPALAEVVDGVPELGALRDRLAVALEPDGRVKDSASPALKRLRGELAAGEKQLARQLERWGRGSERVPM